MIGAGIRETGDRERGGRRSDPQPKRRGWFARVLGFVVCVGLGSVATLALTAYHPRPRAVAGLEDLGGPVTPLGRNRTQSPPRLSPPPQAGPRASRVPGHLACIRNKGGLTHEP
jgi:hypothetical protein